MYWHEHDNETMMHVPVHGMMESIKQACYQHVFVLSVQFFSHYTETAILAWSSVHSVGVHDP
jgi:hypothetical protein